MIEIKEASFEDIENILGLWADGDVMRFVGFPEGLAETPEGIREMLVNTAARRPLSNYYAIFEDGRYCGETSYDIDEEHKSASLDIKLFRFARGRGIAAKALSHAIDEAFKNGAESVWVDPAPGNAKAFALYGRLGFVKKDMPDHVAAMGEDPEKNTYMELTKKENTNMKKHTMIEKLAREAFEKGGFNGTWLLAENGEIVSKGAVGFRDPEDKEPMTEDSIFQLASVTKQFTAAAVMLVVRQGLLSLDDDITKFFPELEKYRGATVRHLLTHTSGIPDYFDDADWFIDLWKKEDRVPDNPEIVRFLLETETEPYGAPGDQFHYSNTGYNLLAEIVERVTGTEFEEFLKKNIFEPAGMENTRCCHIRRDGVPFAKYAQATVIENDGYVADVDSEEARVVIAFDGLNGDDYVFTNIFDMFKWDRVLREGSVITLEEQKQMYTPAVLNGGKPYSDDDGDGYGFGWSILTEEDFGLIVRHSGGMPGVGTWFERFIDEDKLLVVLTNRDYADARAFKSCDNSMEAIVRGKEPETIVSIEDVMVKDPDKSNWESFCGKYEHPEDDDFIIDEVFMKDGELYVKIIDEEDDEEFECRLYALGGNEFGRKAGLIKLTFGEGSVTYGDNTCKKL